MSCLEVARNYAGHSCIVGQGLIEERRRRLGESYKPCTYVSVTSQIGGPHLMSPPVVKAWSNSAHACCTHRFASALEASSLPFLTILESKDSSCRLFSSQSQKQRELTTITLKGAAMAQDGLPYWSTGFSQASQLVGALVIALICA